MVDIFFETFAKKWIPKVDILIKINLYDTFDDEMEISKPKGRKIH